MSSLFHYNTFECSLFPDILPKDNETFERFQTHIFKVNHIDQPYPIPYEEKWNFYPINYLWDLDEDLDFHREYQKLPYHAHPAGYSQGIDNENSTTDITEAINTFKINSPNQGPSSPFNTFKTISPNEGPSDSSPNQQAMYDNFEDYLEEYTCPDDGYGCCEEHMLEFEMDH